MPNVTYYSDVKIFKKPLKTRVKNFFRFLMVVVVIMLCFLSARFLSSALTVGNLGALIVYGDTTLKVSESGYYAISMGVYSDELEAEKVALGTNIQGAGGYVWQNGGEYHVIGNVYSNFSDAEKVIENLKDTKYNITIMQINFPKLSLDFGMYDNSDMGTIKKAFDILDEVYSALYDYSIRFDKGEITHLAVSSGLSELRGEVKSIIVSVQNLINKQSSDLKKVQNALIKLDELLDQSIIKTIDNTATNYSLKYSIISCVRIKYDLFEELK